MTNQEALRLIKSTDYCFVVWSLEPNAVSQVHAVPRGAPPGALAEVLSKMGQGMAGGFLDPQTTTLATLEKRQQEHERIRSRTNIARSWASFATDDLIHVLETNAFQEPTDALPDVRLIIRELYYSPERVLSEPQLTRLDAIARGCRGYHPAQQIIGKLECWLAVLRNDRDRLKRFWSGGPSTRTLALLMDFAIAAGDLQLDSRDVVDYFIETVAVPGFFAPRFCAMLALGKIGSTAGDDAAAAIAEHIYESSDEIALVRSLSIQRIRTAPSDWSRCPHCVRGLVPDRHAGTGFMPCSRCSGLSWFRPVE